MKRKNRNNRKMIAEVIAIMTAVMLVFTGCTGAEAQAGSGASAEAASAAVYDAASKSEMFTDRDLSGDYDESEAVKISLNGTSAEAASDGSGAGASGVSIDSGTITITAEGTYIFSGVLTDGMIIVDADDSAKVQIVLENADITSQSSAALYVKTADKVFVTTSKGTDNTLASGDSYAAIDDSNIDGAVFARDDITFNGSGTLTVTSPSGHGIVGKDDVKIAGGTVNITAAKHGIQANDSVRLAEAVINITAGTDGIHVSDNSDEENGTESDSYFYIADALVTIAAGDDGIHADAQALIEGGSITVTESYEGIEALDIEISDGDIDVTATDDGINAAGGSSASSGGSAYGNSGGTDGIINISGGKVHITAGGDGIDANGSVTISGGTTIVEGPTQGDTSVIDFNSTGTITGGTFIGTGGAGMAENFTSAENQGVISVSVGNQSAGNAVTLTDADGNVIAEQTPDLDYAVVYISVPDLQAGSTYTLTAGTYSETIEMTDSIYSTLSGGMMGGRGGLGGDQRMQNGSGDQEMQEGLGGGQRMQGGSDDQGTQEGFRGPGNDGDRGSEGFQHDGSDERGDRPRQN